MKTPTSRLEAAIHKLYVAFTENTLNPDDCKQCAVGNILDNTDYWRHFTNKHGSVTLNYVGLVNQNLGKLFNGYSPIQLLTTEYYFLTACGYKGCNTSNNRLIKPDIIRPEMLLDGLESVIGYLCKLDNIKNVMNYSAVFKKQCEFRPMSAKHTV